MLTALCGVYCKDSFLRLEDRRIYTAFGMGASHDQRIVISGLHLTEHRTRIGVGVENVRKEHICRQKNNQHRRQYTFTDLMHMISLPISRSRPSPEKQAYHRTNQLP